MLKLFPWNNPIFFLINADILNYSSIFGEKLIVDEISLIKTKPRIPEVVVLPNESLDRDSQLPFPH